MLLSTQSGKKMEQCPVNLGTINNSNEKSFPLNLKRNVV